MAKEFRFVTPDGKKSTAWKSVPPNGVQYDFHLAKVKLGKKINMEVRDNWFDYISDGQSTTGGT